MEEGPSSRGRARGRSRGTLVQEPEKDVTPGTPTPAEGPSDAGVPMETEAAPPIDVASMYCSDEEENGNGGKSSSSSNGNGSNNGHSPNGNGKSPNGGKTAGRVQMARGFRTEVPDLVQSRPEGMSKIGSSGNSRGFVTNYFELQTKSSAKMRLYRVEFDDKVDKDNISILKALLRQREPELTPYLFDGAQLFTTRDYESDRFQLETGFPDKPERYQFTVIFVRMVHSLEPLAFQLYNLLIRKCQELLDLDLLGRHYFDRNGRINISQHKLELWPGFITSMRQQEKSTMLNVDMTFKVCRTDNVFSLMQEIRQHNQNNYRPACEAAIVGTIVMTKFNRKTYRVDAIDWDLKPTNTFPQTKRGETRDISFLDYYQEKGVSIQSRGQPMLISRPKTRDIRRGDTGDKILIPEMCFQTGLNDEMRANFRLMKDISNHLHMSPEERLRQICAFMGRMRDSTQVQSEMLKWGMRYRTDPVEVAGRQMPTESILFQSGTFPPNEQADWSQAFRGQKMLTCAELKSWVVVCSPKDAQNIDNLVSTMTRVATPLGYRISKPRIIRVNDQTTRSFTQAIHNAMADARGQLDMAMVILPTNRLETYAAVKVMCSIDFGIPSQCFLSKNVNAKGLMSICTKVVIQMNAKQGGEPWALKNPLKGIMVVGFDVHHAGGKSVGAMTATMSDSLATYYSCITRQEPGMEICAEIGTAFRKCLIAFSKNNAGSLPTRIMFYRDGVGVGQLQYVYRAELESIQINMEQVYKQVQQPMPKFSLIVVTKRISTRIFEIRGPGKVANPQPGTVVDDVITCPERYDFFLVPQSARQGTVSPVAFHVLYDTSGLNPDKMQIFTFKLCHLYFNWSGTVPVPAPCQYAHKLAFLTGTALQREANQRLCNFLHFL